jgi:hypothetical protein
MTDQVDQTSMPSLRQTSKPARTTLFLFALFVTVAAAMAAPAAGLAEPAEPAEPPQLVFEPAGHDFGLRPLNWGSDQTTFQLRNAGSGEFQIGSPEIVGPGSGAFWTGNSNCYGTALQPGQSCFAQVYFGPYEAVEFTAQFRVNVGSYSFSADLSGVGGRAIFAPASNPADFGVAAVGSAGTTREIQVSNVGNIGGGVFIAVVSGGAVGSFHLLDENCTGVELAPAATCTLQVRFQPLSEGVKKATLSLFGDSDGGTQVVLTGVGSAPDPAPSQQSGPTASGSADSVSAAATAVTPDPAAHPRAKASKRGSRIRRRHRRAGLKIARQVLAADARKGSSGR